MIVYLKGPAEMTLDSILIMKSKENHPRLTSFDLKKDLANTGVQVSESTIRRNFLTLSVFIRSNFDNINEKKIIVLC